MPRTCPALEPTIPRDMPSLARRNAHMGTMSTRRPQHGACPSAAYGHRPIPPRDMPILGENECAYGHYVHSPTPARGMSPAVGRNPTASFGPHSRMWPVGRPGFAAGFAASRVPGRRRALLPSSSIRQFFRTRPNPGIGPWGPSGHLSNWAGASGPGTGRTMISAQAGPGQGGAAQRPGRTCPVAAARSGHRLHYVHSPTPARGMSRMRGVVCGRCPPALFPPHPGR